MSQDAEPMYTLYPAASEPSVMVKFLPGGEIELPDGLTLDETIAALWAEHAKQPNAIDASFFAGIALLEVRALAVRRVSGGTETREP